MNKLAWGAKVPREFVAEVIAICIRFNWTDVQQSHIMACMAFESGHTFSPSVRNMAGSGATGLIQFMPATAIGLGTTTETLAKMTAVEQLKYVEKYFQPYAKRIKSLSDMYMAILLPKYIGAHDDVHLFNEGTTAYRQNAGLDANNDGHVTKGEASGKVNATLILGFNPGNYALVP